MLFSNNYHKSRENTYIRVNRIFFCYLHFNYLPFSLAFKMFSQYSEFLSLGLRKRRSKVRSASMSDVRYVENAYIGTAKYADAPSCTQEAQLSCRFSTLIIHER